MNDKLVLSAALSRNERTGPILDGTVSAQGVELILTALGPGEMFWRQLKYQDFDISEMSLSSLFLATARGDRTWAALPVFTDRQFFHTGILVRSDAGIASPAQLAGKRVGVPEYQQTSAIWARGVLEHEFGIPSSAIHWFIERLPETSHGGATGFMAPPNLRISQIPREKSIGEMLMQGELDATLFYINDPGFIDRSNLDLTKVSSVRPMFEPASAEAERYYRKTGMYPMNHAVVVRRTLLQEHPWLALNLFSAFASAKELTLVRMRNLLRSYVDLGLTDEISAAHLRTRDPTPYGIRSNRLELETLSAYLVQQELADRQLALEEVFWKSTMDV